MIALSLTDLRPEVMIKTVFFFIDGVHFFDVVVSLPDVIRVSERPIRPYLVLMPRQYVILALNFEMQSYF